jgi:hypothetical protein
VAYKRTARAAGNALIFSYPPPLMLWRTMAVDGFGRCHAGFAKVGNITQLNGDSILSVKV